MNNFNGALRAGSHVWICPIYATFPGPNATTEYPGTWANQNPSANLKPDIENPDENAMWTKITSVISVDVSEDVSEIEANKPDSMAVLTPYAKDCQKIDVTYTMAMESYDEIIHNILFRTKVDGDSKLFTPRSTPMQYAWMHWEAVDNTGAVILRVEEWGSMKVTNGAWDVQDFNKPSLEFTALYSPLRIGYYNPYAVKPEE